MTILIIVKMKNVRFKFRIIEMRIENFIILITTSK